MSLKHASSLKSLGATHVIYRNISSSIQRCQHHRKCASEICSRFYIVGGYTASRLRPSCSRWSTCYFPSRGSSSSSKYSYCCLYKFLKRNYVEWWVRGPCINLNSFQVGWIAISSRQRANLATRSFFIWSISFSSSCKYLRSSSIHIGLSRASMMSSSRVVALASSASSSTSSRTRPWVDFTWLYMRIL